MLIIYIFFLIEHFVSKKQLKPKRYASVQTFFLFLNKQNTFVYKKLVEKIRMDMNWQPGLMFIRRY